MDGDRVSVNEPYYQGPDGKRVIPRVLLLEGMAQTAGALCMRYLARP
jgi:3-hydroxyacyl-[acyl-carrier-protein] dehydratase